MEAIGSRFNFDLCKCQLSFPWFFMFTSILFRAVVVLTPCIYYFGGENGHQEGVRNEKVNFACSGRRSAFIGGEIRDKRVGTWRGRGMSLFKT